MFKVENQKYQEQIIFIEYRNIINIYQCTSTFPARSNSISVEQLCKVAQQTAFRCEYIDNGAAQPQLFSW